MFMEAIHRLERLDDRPAVQDLHPERGAQLRHRGGGLDTMADDVADNQHQPVLKGYRVKPVATGRGVLRGDEVFRGDVGAWDDGNGRGQQRLLHDGGRIPDVTESLGQLLDVRLGGQPRLYPLGDVIEGDLYTLDRSVRAVARRDEKVEDLSCIPEPSKSACSRHSAPDCASPVLNTRFNISKICWLSSSGKTSRAGSPTGVPTGLNAR